MKKSTKALLIPIAAFAVTVTGVSAFSPDMLERANLSEEQRSAFEQAYELRKEGNKEGARDVLAQAGVDMEAVKEVHQAIKGKRQEMHEAIEDAMKDGDYEAFLQAVADSPMLEKIDTPEEFDQFTKAYKLKELGDMEGARAIMADLGFDGGMMKEKGHGIHKEKKERGGMHGMMMRDHKEEDGEKAERGMMR